MYGASPLLATLCPLFLLSAHTLAFGQFSAPQKDALYHDEHITLQGRTAADDHLEGSEAGAIPLVRIHHRHVGKRENHIEFITPSKEIVLDWHFPDNRIRTFEYSHENRSYVNLEHLQSHGLLLDHRSICMRDDTHKRSTLNIDFRYEDTYYAAKQQWTEPDLLFVIEDESCHEGSVVRSVYRSEDTVFNDDTLSVQIAAEDLSFGAYEVEAAHSVTIITGSFEALKKRHSTEPFFLTSRTNTHALNRLIKRQLDDPTGLSDEIGDKMKEFTEALKKAGPKWVLSMLKEIEDKMSFNFNRTVNINFEKNYDKETFHAEEDRKTVVEPSKIPIAAALPTVTLVDTFASVHLSVTAAVKFNIKHAAKALSTDMGKSLKKMFKDSIEDIYVEAETTEKVHVRLQAEVLWPLGISQACKIFLWPVPGKLTCTAGPSMTDQLLQYNLPTWNDKTNDDGTPKGKYQDNNMFGINGLGVAIGGGIAILQSATVKGTMNITTPGVEVFIPKGSVAGYGRKNGKVYKSAFDGRVKWLKPGFHTQDLEFDLSLGIGPVFSLDFGMGVTSGLDRQRLGVKQGMNALEGLQRESEEPVSESEERASESEERASKSEERASESDELQYSEEEQNQTGTHDLVARAPVKPTLQISLYARAETPSMELKVFTKQGVDEKCEENGPFKDAFGVSIDLKVGFFAGVDLPGGFQIDTSWIKTGIKGISGLKYVVDIWKKCWDISNTKFGKYELGIEEDIADGLNRDRNNLADAYYNHEGDGEGDSPSAYMSSPVGFQTDSNPSTMMSYPSTYRTMQTYPTSSLTSHSNSKPKIKTSYIKSKPKIKTSYKPSPSRYSGTAKWNSIPTYNPTNIPSEMQAITKIGPQKLPDYSLPLPTVETAHQASPPMYPPLPSSTSKSLVPTPMPLPSSYKFPGLPTLSKLPKPPPLSALPPLLNTTESEPHTTNSNTFPPFSNLQPFPSLSGLVPLPTHSDPQPLPPPSGLPLAPLPSGLVPLPSGFFPPPTHSDPAPLSLPSGFVPLPLPPSPSPTTP